MGVTHRKPSIDKRIGIQPTPLPPQRPNRGMSIIETYSAEIRNQLSVQLSVEVNGLRLSQYVVA